MRTSPAGWVPVERTLLESPLWEKPATWVKTWLWLRCAAAWRETDTCKAGQLRVTYNPTQIPGVSTDQWRRCIAWLEEQGHLRTSRERYGMLITFLEPKEQQSDTNPDSIDAEFRTWITSWPVQRNLQEAQRAYRSARTVASAADLQAGRDKLLDAIRFGYIATNRVPFAHRWLNNKRWTDSYSTPKPAKKPVVDPIILHDSALKYWSDKLWDARLNTAESESLLSACRKATADIPKSKAGETLAEEVISLVNYWKDHRTT